MRVASRAFHWIGSFAFVFALLLASPGVRVGHAEIGAAEAASDFSWDPALEPAPAAPSPAAPSRFDRTRAVAQPPGTCAAQSAPMVLPSARSFRGLEGMPLLIADGDEQELNSLNGRGYNIGKTEPSADLQKLMVEIQRQAR